MPTTIKPTTSFTTPDPGQGGSAVTGGANTGHASTTSTANGDANGGLGENIQKTCIWSGVGNVSGIIASQTLKITHTSSGSLVGGSDNNEFLLEYSLNGGGAWNTAVQRLNMTSSQGPTVFSVALSISQDLTQIRVRDLIEATSVGEGNQATASATISDIQVEVVTTEGGVITFGI